MTIRWKELTVASDRPVSISDAKAALRVIDTQSIATYANRSMGTGNSQLLVVAKIAGTIGNQYSVRILVAGLNTALSVSFANNILTINSATDGAGAATSKVNDIIAKMYATPEAAAIFDATGGSGNGTGVIVTASVGNLSAGVDSGDEDAYVGFLIDAVTEVIEARTGCMVMQRTFRQFWDEWPDCDDDEDEIELGIYPVISVQAVKYYDTNDQLQSFSDYILDAEDIKLPARIVKKFGFMFPPLSLQRPNVVYVDFTAGYSATAANIPKKLRQCILFLVAHWYANREPVISGTAVLSNKVPFTFETVLSSFRLLKVV